MEHPASVPSGSSPPQGDSPGARLYQVHASAIFAYLRLRTDSREEAEDLLFEVFLAAMERLVALENRTDEAQRAWLRGVAAHKVADRYRRGTARAQVTLEQAAEALYADESHSPEYAALQREEEDRLRAVLEQLPALARQVVSLRFVYGLSCAEIAETLGRQEGAVRKQLWRALNRIRALYAED